MTLLDTCFLIDLSRRDRGAIEIARNESGLKISSITSAEFLFGAWLNGKSDLIEACEQMLLYFETIPFDSDCTSSYAQISSGLKANGDSISSFDELIAAVAITHNLTIITRDKHFSRIPGLSIRSY